MFVAKLHSYSIIMICLCRRQECNSQIYTSSMKGTNVVVSGSTSSLSEDTITKVEKVNAKQLVH